ncbi:MAG: cell division protein FtsZ [Cyclobacteriaceae bacterium]|nr:cell division protein FtsZ [Cyclobacteriaceae bacterium]
MFQSGAYKFDLPARHSKSIIKVIGVGGGGSNAVNHMYRLGIKDVEFIVCNTDLQALNSSPVPTKLQIGTNLTEGLGCGANPEVGRAAAMESKEQIREVLHGTKMVFITAGMGGGTGTGAAPVIAKIAKEMDILTVGIVTMPFGFEGRKKLGQAQLGLDAMRSSCDTVLAILNDQLRQMFGNLSISQAFGEADGVLTTAAKSIAEIITLAGYVNVDFQDVRTVMLNAGAAVMGSAETTGEDRAIRAAQQALASPLLDNCDIMGAKRILLSIMSGEEAELQMDELSTITEYIQEQAGDECEVIFGHGVDAALGNSIRVTVIATGFASEGKSNTRKVEEKKVLDLEKSQSFVEEWKDQTLTDRNYDIELKVTEEIHYEETYIDEPINDFPETKEEHEAAMEFVPVAKSAESVQTEWVVDPQPEMSQEETEEPILEEPKMVAPVVEVKPEIIPEITPEMKPEPQPEIKPVQPEVKKREEKPLKKEEAPLPPLPLFDQEDVVAHKVELQEEEHEEEDLRFRDDREEFEVGKEIAADQVINNEGMMEMRKTKERLQQQAKERREKLKSSRKQEMSKEEFNEKWTLPAYLRRGVKMENVPHSSERFISKYNLNDDNSLLGNNKFLHDNVD